MDEASRVLALAEHLLREQLVVDEVDARLAALMMIAAVGQPSAPRRHEVGSARAEFSTSETRTTSAKATLSEEPGCS